jgi:hypothetical protein
MGGKITHLTQRESDFRLNARERSRLRDDFAIRILTAPTFQVAVADSNEKICERAYKTADVMPAARDA